MTTEEFKILKPEYANVEGDELWDAMTNYMLRQQGGDEILKQIMPIWKTHTLRWLFYRKLPNFRIRASNNYMSTNMCGVCKKGVDSYIGFAMTLKNGTHEFHSYCPHCRSEYKAEPNTNISHKLYKIVKSLSNMFWLFLDKIHLIRYSVHGRYDMCGDEARYITNWKMNFNKGTTTYKLKKRKWYEYILIEKPHYNF